MEDRVAASERLYIKKFGSNDADHAEEHSRWAAQRGTDLAYSIEVQCEATALRSALVDALPLLEGELETLKRSFLPVTNTEEAELLAAYTQATTTIQGLLAQIPN